MCPSCGIISCELANAIIVENHRTLNRVLVAIASSPVQPESDLSVMKPRLNAGT